MQIKETIEALNQRIAIDDTVKAYNLTERLTVDKKTILSTGGQDAQVAIDDSFNAVLWHRLIGANYSPYTGRGATDQVMASYRVRLVCYSKDLCFSDFIASQMQSDNTLILKSASFDKEAVIKQELPEAQRNFDIKHYFFAFEYEAKAIIDSRCIKFCFK